PGKKSMCVSGVHAIFLTYMAKLHNSGKIHLTADHIKFLNGSATQWAFWGNTYTVASFFQILGGKNFGGKGSAASIRALQFAKPGDMMKYDRSNGTGHAVMFAGMRGGEFCYYSSQRMG